MNPLANAGDAGDLGSISGSGRFPGGGNGNPLQYSCLGKLMDRGAWQVTIHGVTEVQTRLNTHTHTSKRSSSQLSSDIYIVQKLKL